MSKPKQKQNGIAVTMTEFKESIRIPVVLKGCQATTVIGENQQVVVTVAQAGSEPAGLDGPRALVKWLERDPETRVDFWMEIGEPGSRGVNELVLTSVYA